MNLLTELMSKLPYDHPARMNYKSIEIAPEKTYGSILSTLQSKLGKFDSKEIAEVTSTDSIDFEEWNETNSLPTTTGSYVLNNDITLPATWNINTGSSDNPTVIDLCLNGHIIKLELEEGVPCFQLAAPLRHREDDVQEYAAQEIRNCIKFIEEHYDVFETIFEEAVLGKNAVEDIEYSTEELDTLTLSYACTCHKAQGAEFGSVIVILEPVSFATSIHLSWTSS